MKPPGLGRLPTGRRRPLTPVTNIATPNPTVVATPPMKIVTADLMRQIDRECVKQGTPVSVLMENAGKAVAGATRARLGDLAGPSILCLVGTGNNGGDGLVAARYLHDWG